MPRTQKSLDKNLSKLTTTTKETKVRKTRSDKKPVFTKVKSTDMWDLIGISTYTHCKTNIAFV